MQSHSLAVGHRKRCYGTVFHKMCNIAHKLLVVGKEVMKLPVKCHSLAIVHGKSSDETTFQTVHNMVTHLLLII